VDRVEYLVGAIEAPRHRFLLACGNPGAGVADAHDRFVAGPRQAELNASTFGSELHGIVDEIGDRLEQEIRSPYTTTSPFAPTTRATFARAMPLRSAPSRKMASADAAAPT
jgi:hypothetical protein